MQSTNDVLNTLKVEVYDLNMRMAELEKQAQETQQLIAEKNAAIKQLTEKENAAPE